MARTRGIEDNYAGVLTSRDGKPIPTGRDATMVHSMPSSHVVHGPGTQPVAPGGQIIGYRADRSTWSKNMEAHELATMLDLAFANPAALGGGFMFDISVEQWTALSGDVRRHFMAVRS